MASVSEPKESNPMNMDEGDRIGQAEIAITGLSGRVDGLDAKMATLGNELVDTKHAVDRCNDGISMLLQRTGGIEANKGMVPMTYIWSALASFIALLSISMTALSFTNSAVRSDIADSYEKTEIRLDGGDQFQKMKHDHEREVLTLMISALRDDADENTVDITDHENRILHIEKTRSTADQFADLVNRISDLEVREARNDEKIQKTLDDVADH
jgi:hypothetical protein